MTTVLVDDKRRDVPAAQGPVVGKVEANVMDAFGQPDGHRDVRWFAERHAVDEGALLGVFPVRAHGADGPCVLDEKHHRPRDDLVQTPDIVGREETHVVVDPHGEPDGTVHQRVGGLQRRDGLSVEMSRVGGEEFQLGQIRRFLCGGPVVGLSTQIVARGRFKPQVGQRGHHVLREHARLVAKDHGAQVARLHHVASVAQLFHQRIEGLRRLKYTKSRCGWRRRQAKPWDRRGDDVKGWHA